MAEFREVNIQGIDNSGEEEEERKDRNLNEIDENDYKNSLESQPNQEESYNVEDQKAILNKKRGYVPKVSC